MVVIILAGAFIGRLSSGEVRHSTVSLGGPNHGKLAWGRSLPQRGKGFISNPGRTNPEAEWGTDELVGAIIKVGADLQRLAPGPPLVVNDLSLPEGGEIPRHQSHEAGRDVDLVFFLTDLEGAPLRPRAVRFDDEGRGELRGTDREVLFDTPRNWIVLKSFILNDEANLQRVFVSEGLRALMLEHAREAGEPGWVVERAGEVMCQPSVPHDDHFHLRLHCTAEDYRRGCRDSWPIYPWRRTEMARLGIPVVETAPPEHPLRRRRRSRRRRRPTIGRVWCP